MRIPFAVAILLTNLLYVIFYGHYYDDPDAKGFDAPPCDTGVNYHENPEDCIQEPEGILDTIGATLGTIWGVVKLVLRAMTAQDVPGAPWPVQTLVFGYFMISSVWSLASLVRGVTP